ncbi:MAG: right-handed parallel beta-helix repeat-containing protein, partial [Nitrososphaerales archaeon]
MRPSVLAGRCDGLRQSRLRALPGLAITVVVMMAASAAMASPLSIAATGVNALGPGGGAATAPVATANSSPSASSDLEAPELAAQSPVGGPAPGGPTICPNPSQTPFAGQVVITAHGTISPGGAPVTQSGGRYSLTGPVNGSVLDLASNTTIDGSGCALIYTTGPITNYGNATGVEVRFASNVTVENFPITANGSRAGVWVNHSASITVYNVSAEHETYGLGVNASTDVNMTSDNASYSHDGVYLNRTIDGFVDASQAVFTTTAAFEVDTSSQTLILDNDGADSAYDGVNLLNDSGTRVVGNDLSHAGVYGLNEVGGSLALIRSNDLSGTGTYGVSLYNTTGSLTVTGNDLTGGW